MSTNTARRDAPQRDRRTVHPRRARLAEVAREIRDDARRAPERYLEQTEVPAGGE